MKAQTIFAGAVFTVARLFCGWAAAQDFDREPINYESATPDNLISQLQKKIDAGQKKLPFSGHFGYLSAVLQELDVPVSSQMLVYSKTSLQRHRITPRTPRALYFNDAVSVGFCQDGDVLEIAAVDSQLGTVFYTLNQDEVEQPHFRRHTDNCLICHASSQTQQIPGHTLRSVFTDDDGQPVLSPVSAMALVIAFWT